jgi:DNA-binding transcriptional ArsR family regulator
MDIDNAIIAFSALSQETRLKVFKMLVEYGATGTPAGTLSDRLGIPHNTLSFHLTHLSHSGLITSRKDGRSIIYSAQCDMIEDLIGYLKENCCALEDKGDSCCPPTSKKGTKK